MEFTLSKRWGYKLTGEGFGAVFRTAALIAMLVLIGAVWMLIDINVHQNHDELVQRQQTAQKMAHDKMQEIVALIHDNQLAETAEQCLYAPVLSSDTQYWTTCNIVGTFVPHHLRSKAYDAWPAVPINASNGKFLFREGFVAKDIKVSVVVWHRDSATDTEQAKVLEVNNSLSGTFSK
jgi:hypothetical protein